MASTAAVRRTDSRRSASSFPSSSQPSTLYSAAKVMELIAAEHRPSELVDLLPGWHFANRSVNCPWDREGQIMRRLFDETNGAK